MVAVWLDPGAGSGPRVIPRSTKTSSGPNTSSDGIPPSCAIVNAFNRATRSGITAAGSVIVEEAGGRVTELHGARLDVPAGGVLVRNKGVIASNGHLHAAALGAVPHIRRLGDHWRACA